MSADALFERDMLYPTENLNEPGSVHIKVLNPNNNAKIPVIIESKTVHSPLKYMDSIARIMQTEIFDRIFIDIKKNVFIYIVANSHIADEASGKPFIKVKYGAAGFEYSGADKVE
jgi:hypothetical protein